MVNKIRYRPSRAMTEMAELRLDSLQLQQLPGTEKDEHNEETSLCHIGSQGGSHLSSLDNGDILELSIDEAIDRIGMGRFQMQLMVAAGLCFASDAMEILLLSFLSLVLLVEWDLTIRQASYITSSVFAGAFLGTLILGRMGDVFGRKPVFILTASIIAFFGVSSAFVSSYPGLVMCRFFIGFGVGGIVVPFDILAEFMPTSSRGRSLVTTSYFWTTATLVVPILAYCTLGRSKATHSSEDTNDDVDAAADRNWRIFVALCAIPCTISAAIGMYAVPESPRWLLEKGEADKALTVLRQAAAKNGRDSFYVFPAGTRLRSHAPDESATFCELLSAEQYRTTLTLWCLWGLYAFLYYGTIIAVSLVFSNASNTQDGAVNVNNHRYHFDYLALIVSSSAEVAGVTWVLISVDRFGRINCMSAYFFIGGTLLLSLCVVKENYASLPEPEHRTGLIILAFFARMFVYSGSCIVWISTAELLTTKIRATGHSTANAIARVGAFLAPIVVSPKESPLNIGIIMFVSSLLIVVCTRLLPETAGQPLGMDQSTVERGQRRRVPTENSTMI